MRVNRALSNLPIEDEPIKILLKIKISRVLGMRDYAVELDQSEAPAAIRIAPVFNVAVPFIDRHKEEGRGAKAAIRTIDGEVTYAELAERVNRCGNALKELGVGRGERVLMMVKDCPEFLYLFFGAIKSGLIPVPVNTMLRVQDYTYLIGDSECVALIYSPEFGDVVSAALELSSHRPGHVMTTTGNASLASRMAEASNDLAPMPASPDDDCFWLYSSGSTGTPKGTVHVHSSMIQTAELYARPLLGINENDTVFSAAKIFFAYGLGNALSFPLSVGATTLLMAERPTPAAVFERLRSQKITIFCGVPTLYAALLAHSELPAADELNLRHCISAGEPLPADIARRWRHHFGVDILDGIGSTEMLHIFLSNRAGALRYGTTGKPVPGYELRIVNDEGAPVARGEIGELQVSGPTSALMYWNNRDKTRDTFMGEWTRTGDKYQIDEDGFYVYCGRSDDMLKVGGIYVSPTEVEGALITHAAVMEAAVVGRADDAALIKPAAYVVLQPGVTGSDELAATLKAHVKSQLAPYKYPRWIEFVSDLPKTATGKIQRFKLRD